MKRNKAILALAVPTVGAVALLFWSLGFALIECFYNGSCSLGEFFKAVGFIHLTVFLFNIPAYVWIPSALAAYGVGVWLVLTSGYRKRKITFMILGILLSLLPTILIALAPMSEYKGP